MMYFIGGDEPYLVDCRKRDLRGNCWEFPEINTATFGAMDESVLNFLSVSPFMDKRRVATVRVDDIQSCEPFYKELDLLGEDRVCIVHFNVCDQRKSFFKTLRSKNQLEFCNKASAVKGLKPFLNKKVAQAGKRISPEVLDELLVRENYPESEDVTLYSILSDLRSIIGICEEEIGVEAIRKIVPEHHTDAVFSIASFINKRDVRNLKIQAEQIKGNEIAALSALLREYRIAYKSICGASGEVRNGAFTNLTRTQCLRGIEIVTKAISDFKMGRIPKEDAALAVFFDLCSL